jgi:hypothetical protein
VSLPAVTRAASSNEKMRLRTEACVACSCEKFEPKGYSDGFPTCECGHTQWGHKPAETLPAEAPEEVR